VREQDKSAESERIKTRKDKSAHSNSFFSARSAISSRRSPRRVQQMQPICLKMDRKRVEGSRRKKRRAKREDDAVRFELGRSFEEDPQLTILHLDERLFFLLDVVVRDKSSVDLKGGKKETKTSRR